MSDGILDFTRSKIPRPSRCCAADKSSSQIDDVVLARSTRRKPYWIEGLLSYMLRPVGPAAASALSPCAKGHLLTSDPAPSQLCGSPLVTAGFNLHSGYDPSVEQMDATFGVLCEARIVRALSYDYGWGLTRR